MASPTPTTRKCYTAVDTFGWALRFQDRKQIFEGNVCRVHHWTRERSHRPKHLPRAPPPLSLALGLIVDFSGSQEHFVKHHHRHLQKFLDDVLRPGDRAFLVGFGNHLRVLGDLSFTSEQLMEGLKQYEHDHGRFPELGPPDEHRELGTAFYDPLQDRVLPIFSLTSEFDAPIISSESPPSRSSPGRLT